MKQMLLSIGLLTGLVASSQGDYISVIFLSISEKEQYRSIHFESHSGYVITLKNDTISGEILMAPKENSNIFDIYINAKRFSSAEMKAIVLKSTDTIYSNLPFTEFSRVMPGSEKFYRKIMDGRIVVYDDWLLVNEKPGTISISEMLFVKENRILPVFDFWATSDKRKLIRLLNELLNAGLTYRQFRSKYEVLLWLKKNI